MNTGIAILCRSGSSRLPGKVLKEIHGRAVLGHIIDRVRRGATGYPIVVCTSDDSSDDAIARWCRWSDIECFRGPLDDVAGRFLACAEHYGWEAITRINGDNLYADPDTIMAMLAIASTGEYDFVTNVPGRTFPYGMSVEILRTEFYREAAGAMSEPSHREHVTTWLYENEHVGRRFVFENKVCPEASGLHLALDTEEDFRKASDLIGRMTEAPERYSLPRLSALIASGERSTWRGRHGPLLIAEIGGNHEGDFEVAKSLATQAIGTGADFVKFQLYRGDTLVSPVESPDRNAHFKKFELTREQHIELARMCREGGVGYMASVWDLEMLDWVDEYMPIYKIGSGDLTAWPVVREFARRGKPIILSTGLSTLDEILQIVAQLQVVDERYRHPEWLCLLQCTSMYPIKETEANLRVMETLHEKTGLSVGYSDHTETGLALRTAAAMGARVLEFHFTDSREGKVFRDHKVSLTPDEVRELQGDLDRIEALRGSRTKVPEHTEIEQGHVTSFRRAVYAKHDIDAGMELSVNNLVVLRPNHGIDARDMDKVIGKSPTRNVQAFKNIRTEFDDD